MHDHVDRAAGGGVDAATVAVVLLAVVVALGYVAAASAQTRRSRRWPSVRTACFVGAVALAGWSLWTPWLPFEHGDLRQHMLQHLMIGMYAPLGIVLAAPVTLALRTLPPARSRQICSLLRSRPARLLTQPVVALVVNVGGLVALYLTPLYGWVIEHPSAHVVVHLHFLAAGCLFAWVIAGADPVPYRWSVPGRLVLIGAAVVAHAAVAQLVSAGIGVELASGDAERRGAGDLMYYGGDIAEVLLAVAILSTWRNTLLDRPARRRGKSLQHSDASWVAWFDHARHDPPVPDRAFTDGVLPRRRGKDGAVQLGPGEAARWTVRAARRGHGRGS